MKINALVFGAIMFFLAGCSAVAPTNTVAIANNVRFHLVQPQTNYSITQKITATFQGETQTFIMQTQILHGEVILAGLTPAGAHIFSVTYNGKKIDTWKSPLFTAPFDGAYVLADFELSVMDVVAVQKSLPDDIRVIETKEGAGSRRNIINRAGISVIDIVYSSATDPLAGSVDYCHRERGYCLHIETLSVDNLP
jgi:hypothetical protein